MGFNLGFKGLKQQQAPDRNLAFLIAGDDYCFVFIGFLLN